ncbi:LLM class flavin-dependent oxidoreductase [Paenibacillus rhizophilus]|uniref:LLM class flavin-dependent oxidoreductase n=1 Tax=Paenibacillus rhizophilus TaxID=1850366 RepID=A0A3N9PYU0_9BACL|nr:LLM class flavin-dependent oxidoreductase [Paenibacillus rhizophilus]RQW11572.1 LLM class flavin-dependent oxidoreductase [Paenibacillus rhizophilus]
MGLYAEEIRFGWFLPTSGDGRYVGTDPEREPSLDYLIEVAQMAERSGFEFVLIPTGGSCLDSWVVGSAVMSRTTRLHALVAVRPGLIAPVLAARMAASLDQLSGGRAMINVVTGSSVQDLEQLGDPLAHAHDDRYERAMEYMQVMKLAWTGSPGSALSEFSGQAEHGSAAAADSFEGKYFQFRGPVHTPIAVQRPHPPLYLGGSSLIAKQAAAQHADTYLMWGEPHEWISGQIDEMEDVRKKVLRTTGIDRKPRYGLRAQVLIRDTEEEAWAAAWSLISRASSDTLRQAKQSFAKTDAANQSRQNELREQSAANDFVLGPNLWSGLSLVRSGGAMLIVGTAEQVTDVLIRYAEIGISTFILSGYPHLEEADNFGQKVLPLFRKQWSERR